MDTEPEKSVWSTVINAIMSIDGRLISYAANLISAVTILSCVFLKVPQINHLRTKQSADGVYIQAMMLEIAVFSVICLYNFTNEYNFMTYLEYPIILLQVYILIYYVLKYKRQLHLPVVPMIIFSYVVVVGCFAMGVLPKTILSYLVPFCTPLSGFAKVTYIYGMVKTANSDNISILTWTLSVITNLARVLTVYMDSCDLRLIVNFSVSAALSAVVLLAAIYYQAYPGPPPMPLAGRRRVPSYRRHIHLD